MSTPTPYLDLVILGSTAYPSGFSYSLYRSWKGVPRQVSTGFLIVLLLPFLAVTLAARVLSPELFPFRAPGLPLFVAALLSAPAGVLLEYAAHGFVIFWSTGSFPRAVAVQRFWQRRLPIASHVLLGLIAIGEEVFYRLIWLGCLVSFGLPVGLALGISSAAYGLNHLSFGGSAVAAKTISGILYGALFLAGGNSILLPAIAHAGQNLVLLEFAGHRGE